MYIALPMRAVSAALIAVILVLPVFMFASAEEPSSRPAVPPEIEVFDMSWEVRNGIPIFFDIYNGMENIATVADNGYYMNRLTMTEHTSTHMDAPCHFVEGTWCVDEVPLERLYGVAVIIDASRYITNPNDTFTLSELKIWEGRMGFEIPYGSIVIVYTGWSDYWGLYDSWEEYMEATGGGFPGFSEDLADYLISKGVIGVGIDTLSIDPAPSTDFIFHKKLLATNAWALENVKIPKELLDRVVFLTVAPMKIDMGSGAPTRIFAFAPKMPEPPMERTSILYKFNVTPSQIYVEYVFASEMKRAFDAAIKYDLSWEIRNGIPIFFNIFNGFSNLATIESLGYYINRLVMTEHTSTHMDAPCHFVDGVWCVDDVGIDRLISRGVVMDMSWAISYPNDTISRAEISSWERETNIKISPGDILLTYTGWGDYWGLYEEWSDYMEATGGGFPGFSEDAAPYLIDKGVYGVGIDTLSIDPAPSTLFPFHVRVLGKNIYGLENVRLTGEMDILNSTGTVFVYPFKVGDGSGGTSRIIFYKGLDLWSVYSSFKSLLQLSLDIAEKNVEYTDNMMRSISQAFETIDNILQRLSGELSKLAGEVDGLKEMGDDLSKAKEDLDSMKEDLANIAGELSTTSALSTMALALSIIALVAVAAYIFIMRRS